MTSTDSLGDANTISRSFQLRYGSSYDLPPDGFSFLFYPLWLPTTINQSFHTKQYDRSGRSTGVATVNYESNKQAKDAINRFDGNLAKGEDRHLNKIEKCSLTKSSITPSSLLRPSFSNHV